MLKDIVRNRAVEIVFYNRVKKLNIMHLHIQQVLRFPFTQIEPPHIYMCILHRNL